MEVLITSPTLDPSLGSEESTTRLPLHRAAIFPWCSKKTIIPQVLRGFNARSRPPRFMDKRDAYPTWKGFCGVGLLDAMAGGNAGLVYEPAICIRIGNRELEADAVDV